MALTKIQSLGITDGTIVNADINASAAIDGTKLTGVNDAKAWVNFDGTGTVAIRASFNVTSITDNGTGDYTVNFTTAMPDANYCIVFGLGVLGTGSSTRILGINSVLTTSVRVICINTTPTANDLDSINVAIFR
jgi:hypothetical protein